MTETTKRTDFTRDEVLLLAESSMAMTDESMIAVDAKSYGLRRDLSWIGELSVESLDWYHAQVGREIAGTDQRRLELRNDRDLFRNAADHALKQHDRWARAVDGTPVPPSEQNGIYLTTPNGIVATHTQAEVRSAIEDAMFDRVHKLSDQIAEADVEYAKMGALLKMLAEEVRSR